MHVIRFQRSNETRAFIIAPLLLPLHAGSIGNNFIRPGYPQSTVHLAVTTHAPSNLLEFETVKDVYSFDNQPFPE